MRRGPLHPAAALAPILHPLYEAPAALLTVLQKGCKVQWLVDKAEVLCPIRGLQRTQRKHV